MEPFAPRPLKPLSAPPAALPPAPIPMTPLDDYLGTRPDLADTPREQIVSGTRRKTAEWLRSDAPTAFLVARVRGLLPLPLRLIAGPYLAPVVRLVLGLVASMIDPDSPDPA